MEAAHLKEMARQQLLPGIPDEITLDHITTKLWWKEFFVLSPVSRAWCDAIRSRQVYNARVQFYSTETLVLVDYVRYEKSTDFVLALYCPRSNSFCELPPLPDVRWLANCPRCVSVDGKIFAFLGRSYRAPDGSFDNKVYVFDVAGQRKWNRCADRIPSSDYFECGVMDGKVYIFGDRSMVYDPETNTWSGIRPMNSLRLPCDVVKTAGEEFFIYGSGYLTGEDSFEYGSRPWIHEDELHVKLDERSFCPQFLDVYNPRKDEWRVIERFWWPEDSITFVAHGKFHVIRYGSNKDYLSDASDETDDNSSWVGGFSSSNQFSIYVRPDLDENSWTFVHSSLFASLGPVESIYAEPKDVLEVDGELFVILYWKDKDHAVYEGFLLVRSTGFGNISERIEWRATSLWFNGRLQFSWMQTIQV